MFESRSWPEGFRASFGPVTRSRPVVLGDKARRWRTGREVFDVGRTCPSVAFRGAGNLSESCRTSETLATAVNLSQNRIQPEIYSHSIMSRPRVTGIGVQGSLKTLHLASKQVEMFEGLFMCVLLLMKGAPEMKVQPDYPMWLL